MYLANQNHLRHVCAMSFILILATFPLIAYASGFDERGGMIIVGSGMGLIAGFIWTFFLKISAIGKWLALIPMIALGGGMGGVIGNAIGTVSQNSRSQSYLQFEAALSASTLRQLACQDDEAMLMRHLQSTPITETSPMLMSIKQRCFGTEKPLKPRAFIVIARELMNRRPTPVPTNANFMSGKEWWSDSKDVDYYCQLVNGLHSNFETDYLQALREVNLPLYCTHPNDGSWVLGLNVNLAPSQATRGEEIWKYIQFIKVNGVDFKLPITSAKHAMIDYVIRCGEPRLIAFALDYGATSVDASIASAAREWAERKAHPELQCPLTPYTSPAELAEIERISLRLPVISAANSAAKGR